MNTKTTNRKEKTMKKIKSKLFLAALAVSLVAIVSVGSLAWFSDSKTVTNTFMVAESTDDTPDDVFSLDVYEIDPTTSEKVRTGLSYSDVLPGSELSKVAHVANTGYYDQYVRVIVTISDLSVWQEILGTDFNDAALLACFEGFDQTKWNHITTAADATTDSIRIVMYYNDILPGSNATTAGDVTVFTGVNIPTTMEQEHAVKFDDDNAEGFTINVIGQAVQTENVVPNGTTAGNEAYAAFQTVGLTY